jgi:sterol 24-C-methyltransferase
MTDKWDPSNPEHKAIAHGIEVSLVLSRFAGLEGGRCGSSESDSTPYQAGDGIPEMRTLHEARKALKAVGFEIMHEEDLADRELIHPIPPSRLRAPGPDVIPWYYPLEGEILKAQTLWDSEQYALPFMHVAYDAAVLTVLRMTTLGKAITQNAVWGLEKLGFVPKGTYDVGESLKGAADALVKGGRQKLFT